MLTQTETKKIVDQINEAFSKLEQKVSALEAKVDSLSKPRATTKKSA